MVNEKMQLKVAVIGHGYWGKNIARVINQSSNFELHTICDNNPRTLDLVEKMYPAVNRVQDVDRISTAIDVVAIVSPADTHYDLAKKFLEAQKHVLVTKPFTRKLTEAEDLLATSERVNRTIFVDHTFVFNPVVRKIKEVLSRIGEPLFLISQRLNLGLYQPDVNVIYDLMPHDLSIISYLFETFISRAQTSVFCAAKLPQADLAHSSFETDSGIKGLISASWLSPSKIRQFIVVGSKGMLVYDDVAVSEKIKIYDRGISIEAMVGEATNDSYTSRISYRNGDLYSPAVPNTEALAFEMSEFYKAIHDKPVREFYNRLNLNVMKSLESILQGVN